MGPVHCLQDPQISFFSNFFIKNESRGTIHLFKNYFATVFSVFNKISYIQMDIAQLHVDTGSDETWVQGEGCTACFNLISRNFKYKESETYTMVPCDHPLCDPRICIENACHYSLIYADGDYTRVILSSDMFTFPVHDGVVAHFANVIFGVGLENAERPFMINNNLIGGILGLGRGPRSILRQLKDATHQRFSYCLFDFSSGDDTYTYLHFGEDAKIIGNDQETVQHNYYPNKISTICKCWVLVLRRMKTCFQ